MESITVETFINSDLSKVWEAWTNPIHIQKWNFASNDWECPYVENDVKVGGKFLFRMSTKDGSASFDFNGIYTEVTPLAHISYTIEGGRKVSVLFEKISDTETKVIETFELENENPKEMQHRGWQAILNNFKQHVETL